MIKWKPIKGFEEYYSVSNTGAVRNERTQRVTTGTVSKDDGYVRVTLCTPEKGHTHHLVHRLVAIAFHPNPDNLPQVNHKDLCRSHNSEWNLEWVDEKGNIEHARSAGSFSHLAKKYKFISPEGDIVEFVGLAQFCRENGLNASKMSLVNQGKRNHHKGWKKWE